MCTMMIKYQLSFQTNNHWFGTICKQLGSGRIRHLISTARENTDQTLWLALFRGRALALALAPIFSFNEVIIETNHGG